MTIIIGIDPHKASHPAVAIDENEAPLAEFRLAAGRPVPGAAVVGVGGAVRGPGVGSGVR